jgi:hypothetical protein
LTGIWRSFRVVLKRQIYILIVTHARFIDLFKCLWQRFASTMEVPWFILIILQPSHSFVMDILKSIIPYSTCKSKSRTTRATLCHFYSAIQEKWCSEVSYHDSDFRHTADSLFLIVNYQICAPLHPLHFNFFIANNDEIQTHEMIKHILNTRMFKKIHLIKRVPFWVYVFQNVSLEWYTCIIFQYFPCTFMTQ